MTRPIVPAPSAFAGWIVAWLAGPALLGTLVLAAMGGTDEGLDVWRLAAVAAVGWAAFLLMLLWLSRRFATGRPVADYGIEFRPVDLAGIPLGVAVQLVAIPLLYQPLRTLWPDTFSNEQLSERANDLAGGAGGLRTIVLLVVVVVGAPVVEELVYRGLLQRAAATSWQPVAAWLGISALFALIHFTPVEYPGLFAAGLAFGLWPLLTGRIGGSIVTHMAFNAAGISVALWA